MWAVDCQYTRLPRGPHLRGSSRSGGLPPPLNTRAREWRALSARALACQALEHLDAALDGRVAGRVGDAEMGILLAENVTGNDEQLVFDRLVDELVARAPGTFWKNVKRPAGPGQL